MAMSLIISGVGFGLAFGWFSVRFKALLIPFIIAQTIIAIAILRIVILPMVAVTAGSHNVSMLEVLRRVFSAIPGGFVTFFLVCVIAAVLSHYVTAILVKAYVEEEIIETKDVKKARIKAQFGFNTSDDLTEIRTPQARWRSPKR